MKIIEMKINFTTIVILFIILLILKAIAKFRHIAVEGSKNPLLIYLLHHFLTRKQNPKEDIKQNETTSDTNIKSKENDN